jgi:hypothetical protein
MLLERRRSLLLSIVRLLDQVGLVIRELRKIGSDEAEL